MLTSADAGPVVTIWNQAMPAEPLTEAELRRVLLHDPGVVIATPTGVVAATVRGGWGHIRLLAVLPDSRRRGQGRALLGAAEQWLADHGATSLRWGGEVPYYLWPGLDDAWASAGQLATTSGYTRAGKSVNMSIGTDLAVSQSWPVQRITDQDPRMPAVRRFIAANWAAWLPEVDLAAQGGTLFVAFDGGRAVAFMAHSTLRLGWLGPMGADPAYRGRGIGASVLQATCADLAAGGIGTAEIAWVGPTEYFARFGATVCRTFLRMVKNAPGPAAVGS